MSSANGNHFASASKCFQQTNECFIALFWHCKINPAKPSGASWRHNLWPSPTMEKYFSHTNGTHCHNFQRYYHYRNIDMLIIRTKVKPELIFNLLKSNYRPKLPTCGGTAESAIIREILCNMCWEVKLSTTTGPCHQCTTNHAYTFDLRPLKGVCTWPFLKLTFTTEWLTL